MFSNMKVLFERYLAPSSKVVWFLLPFMMETQICGLYVMLLTLFNEFVDWFYDMEGYGKGYGIT